MPIQFDVKNDGKSVAVRVTGKLVKADYERIIPEVERLFQLHGKLRLLFEMDGFQAWEPSAFWD